MTDHHETRSDIAGDALVFLVCLAVLAWVLTGGPQ